MDFVIGDALDVTITYLERQGQTFESITARMSCTYLLIPDLQWFTADTVEDGEKAALERILEHICNGEKTECESLGRVRNERGFVASRVVIRTSVTWKHALLMDDDGSGGGGSSGEIFISLSL